MKHMVALILSLLSISAWANLASPQYDVLIIGAGPVGLTAALEARKVGAKVLVVERRSQVQSSTDSGNSWGSRMRVVILNNETVQVLSDLNVKLHNQAFKSLSIARATDLQNYKNIPENNAIYQFILGRRPHSNMKIGDLEAALLAAAQDAGIEIVFEGQTTIVGNSSSSDQPRVTAKIQTPNFSRTIYSKIAFMADGANSQTAKSIGLKRIVRPGSLDTKMITADFRDTHDNQVSTKFLLDDYGVVHAGALSAFEWTSISVVAPLDLDQLSPDQFEVSAKKLLVEAAQKLEVHGEMMTRPSTYVLATDFLERNRKGSVFAIGDSARRTNPTTAMGVNLGISDAYHTRDLILALSGRSTSFSTASATLVARVNANSDISGERSTQTHQVFVPVEYLGNSPSDCMRALGVHP